MNEQLTIDEMLYESRGRFGHYADESLYPEISCEEDALEIELEKMMEGF